MIFKQIDAILSGSKTQTRRVVKPGEMLWKVDPPCEIVTSGGRIKWETFTRAYAVQPGRGMPAARWAGTPHGPLWGNSDFAAMLPEYVWQPLRIRITAIRQERLQDITEADAKAEGVESAAAYRELWESINGRTPGARWDANPMVWVLTFEVVKEKGAQS